MYRFILIILLIAPFSLHGEAEKPATEIQAIAENILDNILEGIQNSDYTKYSQDFAIFLKESITKEKFLETNTLIANKIGKFKSRQYLATLNQNGMKMVLWKGNFDKTDDDVLIKLYLSKQDDKYIVAGLWFK